jgi:simple sugar transport system permease protein
MNSLESQGIETAVNRVESRVEVKQSKASAWMHNHKRALAAIGIQVAAVGVGLLVGAGLIAGSGASPIVAYRAVFIGAFGNIYNFTETLVKATPILLAGLGVMVAFRCSVWNIGAEGQLRMGALAATAVGIAFAGRAVSGVLLIPLLLVAAFAAGGAWGALAGWLKVRWRVDEVIGTIMLNFIAALFVNYMITGPLREPTGGGVPLTREIAEAAQLPRLFGNVLIGVRLHLGFVIGLIAAGLVYVFLWHTVPGYQLRAVGANPKAAQLGGINVTWNIVLSLIISGGLAGLAGMGEVAGLHYRLIEGFSPNYGATGIIVALLGKLHPLGVVIASILFGGLIIGIDAMTRAVEVPGSIVFVMQGVIVLCVLAGELLARRWKLTE